MTNNVIYRIIAINKYNMGVTKSEIFSDQQNRIADLAKGFAHPARVAILEFLAVKKSCICGDIVEELPLAQATVSQHLKELKRLGLIKGDIDPPRVCYCLDEQAWKEAKALIVNFIDRLQLNCC